ncbi:Yip1 family protein [candidate division KSB1 bacterium]
MEKNQKEPVSPEEVQTTPSTEEKKMGIVDWIINVFTSPTKAFQGIDRNPTWIAVFIIIVLTSIGFQLVNKDLLVEARIKQIEMSEVLSEEQKDSQIATAGDFFEPPLVYVNFITVIVGALLVYLIVAGVLYFTGNVVLGGEGRFRNIFVMYIYTSLVTIPNFLLTTFLAHSRNSLDIQMNLALFLDPESSGGFLYRFLSHIGLFSAWQVVLVAIGFAIIYKFEFKKSLTVIIILQLIYSVMSAGAGSLIRF